MCVENNYEIDLDFYGSHQTCGLSLTRRHVETIFSGPCCGGLLSFWKTSYQKSISWNRKEDSTDAFLLCGDHFLENVEWLKLYSINAVIKNILKVFFFKYGKLFNCLLSTKKYQNTDCVCVEQDFRTHVALTHNFTDEETRLKRKGQFLPVEVLHLIKQFQFIHGEA